MSKRFQTLNVGSANVVLAEYELGAHGALQLINYGSAVLSESLEVENTASVLTPAIQEIIREKGIKPGKLVLAVSGQIVFPKFAAVPMAGDMDRFEQMVRNEIEQNIPFPADEMVCDRHILGDTESGDKSVMIVAAKLDQIEAMASAVRACGFSLELVDVAPVALSNAIRFAHPEEAEQCVVALCIGAKSTSLVISEGEKLYDRSIPVAGNTITKEIMKALGCSQEDAERLKLEKGYVAAGGVTEDEDPEADCVSKACRAALTRLSAEISRSVNFYRSQQHGGTPTKVYLAGGSSKLPQLDMFFAESLGVDVEYINPFDAIEVAPSVDQEQLAADLTTLATTAGMALHYADIAQFNINLLPPSIKLERKLKAKIPFIAIGAALFVFSLVLILLSVYRDISVEKAKSEAVSGESSALEALDGRLSASKGDLDLARANANVLRKLLVSRSQAVQRLNAVRQSLVPGMWIDHWSEGKVTVRSWSDRVKKGEDGKTVSESVVDKLKAKPVIDPATVKILDMSAIGQVEQFTMEFKYK